MDHAANPAVAMRHANWHDKLNRRNQSRGTKPIATSIVVPNKLTKNCSALGTPAAHMRSVMNHAPVSIIPD